MQLLSKAVRTSFGLVTLERLFVYYALQLERIYSGTPTVPGKAAIPAKAASGGNPATPLIPAVPTIPAIPPNAVLGKLSKISAVKEVVLNGTPQSVVSIEIPVPYDTAQWTKSGGDYYSAIKAYENSLAIIPTFTPLTPPTDVSTILPDEPAGVTTAQRYLGWLAQQLVQNDNPLISNLIEVITNDETTPDPIVIFKVKLPIDWNVWIDTNNLVAAVKPLVEATPVTPATPLGDVFKVIPYTTDGTAKTVSGYGFEPDLLWLKRRDATFSAGVYNSARGITKIRKVEDYIAETTLPDAITAINNDGFVLGTNAEYNPASGSFWAAGWDKQPGFMDVVSYVGNGAASRQIAHSLGSAPDLIIFMSMSSADDPAVTAQPMTNAYVRALPNAKNTWVTLGGGDTPFVNVNGSVPANLPFADTDPTATHFTVGGDDTQNYYNLNFTGQRYVAYVFKQVVGKSSFGLFNGTGDANGNVVDCGFTPSFVMMSNADNSGNGGTVVFLKPATEAQPNNRALSFGYGGSETDNQAATLTFLDNGFKCTSFVNNYFNEGDAMLQSGNVGKRPYYYLAFK